VQHPILFARKVKKAKTSYYIIASDLLKLQNDIFDAKLRCGHALEEARR
jgi:hypothetical protein